MSKPTRRSETPAEPDCIFCKIVAGDLPSRRIYEDDHAIAFLDIAAWHRGHTLVVPKRHVTDMITGDSVAARDRTVDRRRGPDADAPAGR